MPAAIKPLRGEQQDGCLLFRMKCPPHHELGKEALGLEKEVITELYSDFK